MRYNLKLSVSDHGRVPLLTATRLSPFNLFSIFGPEFDVMYLFPEASCSTNTELTTGQQPEKATRRAAHQMAASWRL
jgi:hypothetical protein